MLWSFKYIYIYHKRRGRTSAHSFEVNMPVDAKFQVSKISPVHVHKQENNTIIPVSFLSISKNRLSKNSIE